MNKHDPQFIARILGEALDAIAGKVFGHDGPYDGDELFLRIEELVEAEKHACGDGLSALLALIDPEPEDTREDIKERLAGHGIDLDAAEGRLQGYLERLEAEARRRVALRGMAAQWRRQSACLRREVHDGVCVRQSAESKRARAQVLESVAGQVEEALEGVAT